MSKSIKVEQQHLKHKTWNTKVTVGEGDDVKTFGLRHITDSQWRVYTPFGGSKTEDFQSRDAALDACLDDAS